MGTKLYEESTGFGKSYKNGIKELGKYVIYRAQRLWMYPKLIFLLTEVGRKQKKTLDIMRSFRDSVIEQRRESCESGNLFLEIINRANDYKDDVYHSMNNNKFAMLDLLLQAEKDGTIDANGIGEEVDTFMFEVNHSSVALAIASKQQ